MPARRSTGCRRLQFTKVRDDAESPVAIHCQPRASRPQVASGNDVVGCGPLGHRLGGPFMKLVAVSSNDELVARMNPPCENEQAHWLARSVGFQPRRDEAIGDGV